MNERFAVLAVALLGGLGGLGAGGFGCGDDGGEDPTATGTTSDATDSASASTMTSASAGTTTTMSTSGATASTTTSTTSDETSGTGGPGVEGFDDEFDDPGTLADWTRLHETEGDPAPYSGLDIGETTPGRLTLVPSAGGWFGDFDGPFLYKEVAGDFVLETWVRATGQGGDAAPTNLYNSAGIMVRDPASGAGTENWVIHNVGRQSLEVGVATEGKTTRNSTSVLDLTPGTFAGTLRICRVGATVVLTRRLDDEDAFRETESYDRPDLPDTLQVGLMANGWNSNGSEPDLGVMPDVVGSFEYIRLWRPADAASCLAP